MKSKIKPGTYEAIRTRMVFPGAPTPAKGELPTPSAGGKESVNLKELRIQGVTTLPSSVGEAGRQADELLKHCRQRVRDHDTTAIVDLLEVNPAFILDRWVREKLIQFARSGRLRRRRGRPRGRFLVHPLVIAGLVEECEVRGLSKNLPDACAKIAKWLGFLTYERVRELYDQAWGEERFRAILLKFPKSAEVVTEGEMADRVRKAETLGPGGKITRTAEDPKLGTVEITFEAK